MNNRIRARRKIDIIDKKYIKRLHNYIKDFHIKYTQIAQAIGLDKSTVPKYFKYSVSLKKTVYSQIIDYLKLEAADDELKLFLINNYLSLDKEKEHMQLEYRKIKIEQLASQIKEEITRI